MNIFLLPDKHREHSPASLKLQSFLDLSLITRHCAAGAASVPFLLSHAVPHRRSYASVGTVRENVHQRSLNILSFD